jgi:hypothetical protein
MSLSLDGPCDCCSHPLSRKLKLLPAQYIDDTETFRLCSNCYTLWKLIIAASLHGQHFLTMLNQMIVEGTNERVAYISWLKRRYERSEQTIRLYTGRVRQPAMRVKGVDPSANGHSYLPAAVLGEDISGIPVPDDADREPLNERQLLRLQTEWLRAAQERNAPANIARRREMRRRAGLPQDL